MAVLGGKSDSAGRHVVAWSSVRAKHSLCSEEVATEAEAMGCEAGAQQSDGRKEKWPMGTHQPRDE